jgi:hypothetical protein
MEERRKSVWQYLISFVSCTCVERMQTDTELILTKENEIETERSGNKSISNVLLEKETECYV